MKKLAFALALILACGTLAACGGNSDTTSDSGSGSGNPTGGSDAPTSTSTPAATTTGPATTDPAATTTNTGNTDPDPTDEPQDELIDASRFTVDGDLSDWEGLATMDVKGEATTAHKSAVFYAALTTDGLYLACDAYHDVYTSGQSEWYKNSNFEIFIDNGGTNQLFVYANGINSECLTGQSQGGKITSAVMKTTETGTPTAYHTITEVFISNEDLPEYAIYSNTVSLGIAWKTESDLIIGGQYHVNEDGSDEYWAVWGDPDTHNGAHAANKCAMVATPKGLFWFDDYMEE